MTLAYYSAGLLRETFNFSKLWIYRRISQRGREQHCGKPRLPHVFRNVCYRKQGACLAVILELVIIFFLPMLFMQVLEGWFPAGERKAEHLYAQAMIS